jgi:hypothetical protein
MEYAASEREERTEKVSNPFYMLASSVEVITTFILHFALSEGERGENRERRKSVHRACVVG